MKTVLLVTPPTTDAPNAVAYALQRAKQAGAQLLVVVVLDDEITRRVATSLTNEGFVGEKLSENVVDTLSRDLRARGQSVVDQIAEQAKRAGVPFASMIENGDPSEVCARIIPAHNAILAVLLAEKRSWLARFLSRAAAVNVPSMGDCEVRVMDD